MPMESTIFGIIEPHHESGAAVLEAPRAMVERRRRTPDMRTVRIPLHSRKHPNMYAIVDEDDAELVNQYRWYPMFTYGTWYAMCRHDGKTVYMHRIIAQPEHPLVVDHINHDGLDNRRKNLRCVSRKVNQQNRRGAQTSQHTVPRPYVGISWEKRRNRWRAEIQIERKTRFVGYFKTAEDAARARDEAALEHYGPHACFNFPDEIKEPA